MNNERNANILASWSPKQKEIWDCEIEYWESLRRGNREKYLSLWHPDALFWPHWVEHPIEKLYLETCVRRLEPSKATVNITPEAIRIFCNQAIIYYSSSYLYVADDNTSINREDRIVHMWLYENEKWLIIGGMNGRP
jgi:hypothetical protein